MVGYFPTGWKVDRMRSIRHLSIVCAALTCASGCSVSLFNTTHEHKEPSQAIEHRVEVLEQRMNAVEQAAPAAGPANAPASGLTVPASGIEPTHFEESVPAAGQSQKKSSTT